MVNLFHLRDQLASVIDEGVVAYISHYFRNIATAAVSVITLFAVLISYLIRILLFNW